jgi:hypothetical protein
MRPVCALALVCCSILPGAEAAWQQAAGSLSSTAIRAHVEYLTDDLLEGRRAGSRGEQLAARYIAAQLEADGFKIERKQVPLAVMQIKNARLLATRDNVTVELKPGVDFALVSAPKKDHLDEPRPAVVAFWSDEIAARGASGLVRANATSVTQIAIAPAAQAQVQGATLRVLADFDTSEVGATVLTAEFPGRQKCFTHFFGIHDSFGPRYPSASHAAEIAVVLEMARGLSLSRLTPRCTVRIVSHGDGEWSTGPGYHPPKLEPAAHTPRDRITREWDWEALKKKAQDALLRAGGVDSPRPDGSVK